MPKNERRKVIHCARSDGRAYTTSEVNAKLIEKGDDEHRYTEPLKPTDKQYMQWLIKCSDMLVNEFEDITKTKDRYILDSFPAGYHLRAKTYESSTRQHFYLFGHPSGVNQVFRSPNEFVHHLIWLVTDNEDPRDCFCRICSPQGHMPNAQGMDDELDEIKADSKPEVNQDVKPTPIPPPAPPAAAAPPQQPAPTQIQSPKPPATTTPTLVPVPQAQAQAQPSPAPAQASTPAPAPVPKPAATVPATSTPPPNNTFCLYRVGEVIWFKNNNTWRLGLVKKVGVISQPTPNGQTRQELNYNVQPIAHSQTHLPESSKVEMETRPFLTFSVPEVQNPDLKTRVFSQVDWPTYVAQYAGADSQKQQLLGLEASKMAAVQIDHSFSLFNRLATQPDPNKIFYGGIFLGPECIIVGEPVRVRLKASSTGGWTDSSQLIVLVTQRLFTLPASNSFWVVGDLYHLKPAEVATPLEQLAALPVTMRNDIVFRNRVAAKSRTKPPFWSWHLLKQGWAAAEENVTGRFYESHRILRIVDPASFQKAMSPNAPGPGEEPLPQVETQKFLNARGDTNGPEGMNINIGKVPGRFAAVGGAIPHGLQFPLGPDIVEETY